MGVMDEIRKGYKSSWISQGYMVGDNRGVSTYSQAGVLIGVTMRITGVTDKILRVL